MAFLDEVLKAKSFLTFEERFISPKEATGLWFCTTAEDVQAVEINAVKLAPGAQWGDLRRCEAFFKAFPYVFLPVADEGTRGELVERLQQALPGLTLYIPDRNAFRGCRSAAEFREQFGMSRVPELLLDARELPMYGLINLSDIPPLSLSKTPRTFSGFADLDRFTGGFYAGQLSLWTGERGRGKSTLLGQILLEAVDAGTVVCAYSGELDKHQFKSWMSVQAAGPSHVGVYEDKRTGRKMAAIGEQNQRRIDEWWNRKFYLYDIGAASSHSEDSILRTFENAHRCYGAGVFLVDNVMTVGLRHSRDGDYFRAQSNFAGRLVAFAKNAGVHVHLVAHPRKADKGERKTLKLDDIGGSGDLPNRADNVFGLERGQIDLRGKLTDVTVLRCMKNRAFGGTKSINLCFDVKSKRFYPPSGAPDRVYGWETQGVQMSLHEIQDTGDEPF